MRELDSGSFATALAGGRGVVLFHASFSQASENLLLLLGELSHSYPNISFFTVDFDREPELARQAGVTLLPTLQAYSRGRLTRRHEGLIPRDYVEHWLELLDAAEES